MQKVLVSIDTEGPIGSSPVDKMIYGNMSDGHEYGINYLMDFFDERSIKGLFFVDIAEAWEYGEEAIRKVLIDIANRGHDIGVHVHPDHMSDMNRRYLWQYTYEEQYDIIYHCTSFYQDVLGKSPKSFRAGRYGANNDTLKVLSSLGYRYDMSLFYNSSYCKINPFFTWNRMVHFDEQLIEVPVTTYSSFKSLLYSRNDQLDSGLIPSEFKRNIKKIIESNKVDVVSMFVHSFQVLKWRNNPDNPILDKKRLNRFITNFDTLCKNESISFITENDLMDIATDNEYDIGEVDVSDGIAPIFYFGIRALNVLKDRFVLNV